MREKLQTFENYFWGLTKEDFKATSDLVKEFMKANWKEINLPTEIKIVTPDIELYIAQHYRETQFLLQFGIWRLQSIFESLLTTNFGIKESGIKQKIKSLKKNGYIIIKEDELSKWTKLRNILSHAAPEMVQPCPTNLIEADIDEFSDLLLEIYINLQLQKSKRQMQ